jgi:ketosteroid isomerase-like protein
MTDHARGFTCRSRREVKGWMQEWIAASSDGKVSVVEVIDAGDIVVSVLQTDGTNDGPMGPKPATGRHFTTRGVQILHFDGEGRITRHDTYFDQLSIMIQLGFAEPPPASELLGHRA